MKALEGGPWMVLGHYLMVSKWRLNFVPTDEGVANTRVWLRLINVPMEQFYEEALLRMASGVGTPVRIEHTAINVTRGRYARVCVKLNLQKLWVPVLNVMGRRQVVEYEGLYRLCYKCGQFGHRMDQCPTTTNQNVEGEVTSGVGMHKESPARSTSKNPFGPCLMSAHVRKRMEQTQRRMSRRSEPSTANKALNSRLDREKELSKRGVPAQGRTYTVRSCYTNVESYEVRGEQRDTSLQKKGGDNRSTEDGIGSSRFAVLAKLSEEEDIEEKISTLKQKIQAIPSPSGTGGKAHPRPGGKNKGSKES